MKKEKLVAGLLVSIMAVSTLTAVGVTTVTTQRAGAITGGTIVQPTKIENFQVLSQLPQPTEPAQVSGVLKSKYGSPLANADVEIRFYMPKYPKYGWALGAVPKTDAKGRFKGSVGNIGDSILVQAKFRGNKGYAGCTSPSIKVDGKWRTKLTVTRESPTTAFVTRGQTYTVAGKLSNTEGGRYILPQATGYVGLYAVAKGATFHVDRNGWISGGTKWARVQIAPDGTYHSPPRQISADEYVYASYGGDATHWGTTSPLPLLSVRVR